MNLIIDIGNTRTKVATFGGDQIIETYVMGGDHLEDIDGSVDHCIISHTGRLTDDLLTDVFEYTDQVLILDHRTELPFNNLYDTPATLGRDRIAGIAGAQALYPGEASLVIDAGTCVTFDFVTSEGDYIGGNIAPGIEMRLRAMSVFTDKLPLVSPLYNIVPMGKSTESAMQNGAVHGMIYEIEGLNRILIERHEEFNTILTGGAGHYLSQYIKRKIFVHPDLVLVGLNKILSINAQ
ncbi:UNVERIFIED_CONTAM: hypothetical protein GTU68_011296 [Idotea baltica]|nr:hypothetical protein [Idotea baltica]